MSWGKLEQLTTYSGTVPKGIIVDSDVQKVGKSMKKTVSSVLEGHVNCQDFLEKKHGIKNPYGSLIWTDMIGLHKEWFTCMNPTWIQQKVWLLKEEYISSFEQEIPRLKKRYRIFYIKN